jgi:tRNA nucleotidyltransferase/poly(A) polymerase
VTGRGVPLAGAAWLRDPQLARLLQVLGRDGEEARVVGGAVRNALLGEPVGEIDIATTAVPDEVVRRAEAAGYRTVPTGIAHGTVTVLSHGRPFEVTTLRRDVETYGRHAAVAFGRDWKADAERRDFTINALSASADGEVFDYTGGRDDLAARRVRFIGDPDKRIAEDYLRILRFFRFHAAYGEGPPDLDGLAACIRGRAGLDQLSRERTRMELLKLLVARRAAPAVTVMADTGLLIRVLGGVPELASFSRMAELEPALGLAPDAVRRLGALGARVAEDAVRLWERLRLPNAAHDRLSYMVKDWRHVAPTQGQPARALLYRLGAERFVDRVLLSWSRSQADIADAGWREFVALPQRWTPPSFPLKADDFIARGVPKGPALGEALRAAETDWIARDFPADVAAIAAAAAARVTSNPNK